MRSIAWRIRRSFLAILFSMISVMVILVNYINEDLEHTMVATDFVDETAFFLMQRDSAKPYLWESATITAMFTPHGQSPSQPIHPVFSGLPDRYSGEVEAAGHTYLVNIKDIEGGRLYIAKDITKFEKREDIFSAILLFVSICIMGLGYWLITLSSKKLTQPLQSLADHIRGTSVTRKMKRLPRYEEIELAAIAETFNHFLDELESFVQREHTLVNLASHELRTPIAVVGGALDVIEQRGQLGPSDIATLQRIRQANTEMQLNVQALLKLARRDDSMDATTNIALGSLIEDVIEDLADQFNVHERVDWTEIQAMQIVTDAVVAKMLIRNLLQNALQHSNGAVSIRLQQDFLEITDRGPGLPTRQREMLNAGAAATAIPQMGGLGLYLATVMCERLAWKLDVSYSEHSGTTMRLSFPPNLS